MIAATQAHQLLATGELNVLGRIAPASNATYLVEIGEGAAQIQAVYKPIHGEKPLWDFPGAVLAHRERAAYLISELLGWNVVPLTLLREGPAGPGMVQWWREPVGELSPVDVVPRGELPPGYLHVLDAHDQLNRPLSLVHRDLPALRRMALFDVVINNADRKGGHVLAAEDGHCYGVDHGIGFHQEDKLRTVLWGYVGQSLSEPEREALDQLATDLGRCGEHDELTELLSKEEFRQTRRRLKRLLRSGKFPEPSGEWPAIPWPAF